MRHDVLTLGLSFAVLTCGCNSPASETVPIDAAAPGQGQPVVAAPTVVDAATAFDVPAVCSRICGVASELGCKSRKCPEGCQKMGDAPVCTGDVHRFMTCAAERSVNDWRCDEDQMPDLRDPHCADEKARMATCLQARFRESMSKQQP